MPAEMDEPEPLKIDVQPIGTDVWEVQVKGTVDGSNFGRLEAAIEDGFRKGLCRILVDLHDARYVSSAGFGCFLSAVYTAHEKGGMIVIVATPPDIKDVFELLGLSQTLSFAKSREAALKVLSENLPKS